MHDDDLLPDADIDDLDAGDSKSKSQVKRELLALQDLGKELLSLTPPQLAKLPLNDAVLDALALARGIKAHGGLKRQMKYIGRLLREVDEEALRQGLASLRSSDQAANARFHRIEQWRDRLIAGGDEVLAELLSDYPSADRQRLRQLVRGAQKEQAANTAPKSARLLFKELRTLMEAAP